MDRVVGADVTRGVAVLGMYTAHLGTSGEDFWSGTGWMQVADGRSAATFALLAGLSAALLSGGPVPLSGPAMTRARVRVLARAAVLLPLGLLMVLLDTPVAVILPGYAIMFAALVPVLRLPPRALIGLAAAVLVIAPPVVLVARSVLWGDGGRPFPVSPSALLVGQYYPALVWIAYLLVGLAVGRQDLHSPRTSARLAAVGAVAVVAGYGTSAVALRVVGTDQQLLRALLTAEPHADTAPEVVGNVGFTLLLLAACLVLARRVPVLVAPLAATGALALTAYCGHLVAIAVLGDAVVHRPSGTVLLAFVVVALVVTTVWRATLGRGPLERLMHRLSTAAADAVTGARPPRHPAGSGV